MTPAPATAEELLASCYRYAFSVTREPEAARELVHDAWVAVLDKGGPMELPYLLRTIRNRAIDRHRRQAVRRRVAETPLDAPLGSGAERSCAARIDLERAMEQLGEAERRALYLNAIEGWTAQQIAVQTGRPRGTVLSHLHRARGKLRVQLAAWTALALLVIAGFVFARAQAPQQRALVEVATNHAKASEGTFDVGLGYEGLALAMNDLPFTLQEPSDPRFEELNLEGARYCSVRGEIAAQLNFVDATGARHTLYQVSALPFTNWQLPLEDDVRDARVTFWIEGDVMMALASPR